MTDHLVPPSFDPHDAAAAAARFAASASPDVAYAVLDSPVGPLVAASTRRGLVTLSYQDDERGVEPVLDRLAARVSPRILEAPGRLDTVRRELEEYFAGRRTRFDVPIDWALVGPFGRRVLRATAAIPFGEVRTYAQIAERAGNARASRAAGNALGANPMPIVVPCHRVLRTGGGLGGYTGGRHRKEALLRIEGVVP
jgi:methylated-DNA-[protein]-cysteine S-methyltransferase